MGSIQALRSEALALRAKEDTNVQISGYLGQVNKSLGNQITQLLDQLQGVIKERTKAYNQLMSKINKTIIGKDGIGDTSIRAGIGRVNTLVVGVVSAVKGDFSIATTASNLLNFLSSVLQAVAVQYTIKSAIYDYEKAASQLGNIGNHSGTVSVEGKSVILPIGSAVELVEKRDAITPRFKPKDFTYAIGYDLAAGASPWNAHDHRGYVGSLRRV